MVPFQTRRSQAYPQQRTLPFAVELPCRKLQLDSDPQTFLRTTAALGYPLGR